VTAGEIAPGLWRWTVTHPEWNPEEDGLPGWSADVGCLYHEAAEAIVLVDPLVPIDPDEASRFWSALDRDVERLELPVEILLTTHWHTRSAGEVRERYAQWPGARVWGAESFLDQVPLPDVQPFATGVALPGGITAFPTSRPGQVVLWLPGHRALVPGDLLLGPGEGTLRVCPDSWLSDPDAPAQVRHALAQLLDLPVEMVLVSHGEPVLRGGHEALAQALASPEPE